MRINIRYVENRNKTWSSFVFYFFLLFFSTYSCKNNTCNENINSWIKEAPKSLDEFFIVRNEILSNKAFVNKFAAQNILFINPRDSIEYEKYNMPNLKQWFRHGHDYIYFSESDTSFCFKTCDDYPNSANGYIYYKRMRAQYKISVIIVDSMMLKNDWIAHVVKCKGCND